MYQELLLLDLYTEEFKQHEHCHRNFARDITNNSRNDQVMKPSDEEK